MKRFNPPSAPATAGLNQNNPIISPRALGTLGLMCMVGLIASCAAPKAADTAKTDSAAKPEATPMTMPTNTPDKQESHPPLLTVEPAWSQSRMIQTAGELIVSLDARDPSAGTDTWANKGTMGDFAKIGAPKMATAGGQTAVQFNGTSDAYRSEKTTPASINGAHARSIEVWVFNPSLDSGEESMIAWGHRGATLANLSFNYGSDGGYSAATHYDQDMSWGEESPAAGKWHLLTYTYDGKTVKIYDNGEQRGSQDFTLATEANKMNLAAENSTEGEPIFNSEFDQNPQMSLSGFIAVVRVDSGALTPEQVKANFNTEKGRFGIGQ